VKQPPKYRDLNLLFSVNPISSDVSTVTDVEAIKGSLRNLVYTNYFERPFHPEIGGNIRAMLFENMTTLTAFRIQKALKDVINNFEPRVKLVNVQVIPQPDQNGFTATIAFYINNIADLSTIDFFLERMR
jgi:phage baseplate assembly protein W